MQIHRVFPYASSRMSLDALRLISEYMSPAGRINLARANPSVSEALSKWEDVHSLMIDDTKILMAGDVFHHRINISTGFDLGLLHTMHEVLHLCPHSRRIWIQTRLRREHLEVLHKRSKVIDALYISSENFNTQHPLSWEKIEFDRLRSVNILHRMDEPINLKQLLDKTACQALFPITLRHVCLTGILLTAPVMDSICTLTNLRHLDIIGCIIDTQLAAQYVDKFAQLSNLDEFSAPPSMYSFSVKDDKGASFNFRKLHLSKLSIYMECFDENSFFDALETTMPKKLEVLTLYGNYYQLKRSKKYSQWRKFEILFGSMIPQVRAPWWLKEDGILMSHFVRCAPYRVADDFRPMRNTRENNVIQASSWRFDQNTMENDETQQGRQNPTANRFVRFMRPEGAPLAIAPPPHAIPEPPVPQVRRERIRRRPNIPTVAEEQHAAPAVPATISLPPEGSAASTSAPVAAAVPAVGPAAHPSQPIPGNQVPSSASTPENPANSHVVPAAPSGLLADNSAAGVATAERVAPEEPRNTSAGLPQRPLSSRAANDAGATPRRFVRFQEVPPETPAADHPQPIVQQPSEAALVNTQPASPNVVQTAGRTPPVLFRSESREQQEQPAQRAVAGNAAPQNQQVNNVADEQAGANQGERHQDDENVNMMLQGMLQALVEEIVLDAINDERIENAPTDPPPVVSSDATAPNRTNSANSSTTRTPATPPPTEAQQAQSAPGPSNQNTQH